MSDYKLRLSKQVNSPLTITQDQSTKSHVVVFVLGESTTRNRMSLYDYERDTTPILDKDAGILVFKNIISPHTQTYSSLRKVLTLMNHDNEKALKQNTHIIHLARAAGFKTYWISNQKPLGTFENPHSIIAKSSHETHWLNDGMESSEGQHDERVISSLKRVLKKSAEKKFIVLHLLGTHAYYKNRYPEAYNLFKDEFQFKKLKLSTKENETYNEYDNAIAYHDYVLSQVLKTVREGTQNYSFIYFPDHGEEALQDDYLVGHSEAKATKNMYEIPMLFDSSNANLKKTASLQIHKQWSTEDFIHPLHTLLGVKSQYYEADRDLFAEGFKELPRRMGKKNALN